MNYTPIGVPIAEQQAREAAEEQRDKMDFLATLVLLLLGAACGAMWREIADLFRGMV